MANPARNTRLKKEIDILKEDTDNSGVVAVIVDESDMTHLKGLFTGPPDTPYAGGTYQVDIQVPAGYPFQPPKFTMDTKIWHPNISSKTVGVAPPGKAFLVSSLMHASKLVAFFPQTLLLHIPPRSAACPEPLVSFFLFQTVPPC